MKAKTVQLVFYALTAKEFVELRDVCKALNLSIITVTKIRNFLVNNGYLQVAAFGPGRSLAYRPRSTTLTAFGRVSSVANIGSDMSVVNLAGYTYDFEGEEVPVNYTLRLSSNILKEIADYVNSDKEVPFF